MQEDAITRILRQNLFHHVAMHISQAEVATGVAVGQPLVINSQEMKDSRLKIVDGDNVLGDVIA